MYTKKSAVFVIDVARVRVLFRLLPRCRARAVRLSLSRGAVVALSRLFDVAVVERRRSIPCQ